MITLLKELPKKITRQDLKKVNFIILNKISV